MALLTWDRLKNSSALQYPKWQLIGMSIPQCMCTLPVCLKWLNSTRLTSREQRRRPHQQWLRQQCVYMCIYFCHPYSCFSETLFNLVRRIHAYTGQVASLLLTCVCVDRYINAWRHLSCCCSTHEVSRSRSSVKVTRSKPRSYEHNWIHTFPVVRVWLKGRQSCYSYEHNKLCSTRVSTQLLCANIKHRFSSNERVLAVLMLWIHNQRIDRAGVVADITDNYGTTVIQAIGPTAFAYLSSC